MCTCNLVTTNIYDLKSMLDDRLSLLSTYTTSKSLHITDCILVSIINAGFQHTWVLDHDIVHLYCNASEIQIDIAVIDRICSSSSQFLSLTHMPHIDWCLWTLSSALLYMLKRTRHRIALLKTVFAMSYIWYRPAPGMCTVCFCHQFYSTRLTCVSHHK